jgi:hypothetical protein
VILAVVGSRSFRDFDLLERELKRVCKVLKVDEIISGGAAGADSLGLMFARDNNIPATVYFPDWTSGRDAGLVRNVKMAEKADMVVAFWDGESRGTAHMIEQARARDKVVQIVRFDQQQARK